MKSFIIVLCLTISSCLPVKGQKVLDDYAVVSGKITNYKTDMKVGLSQGRTYYKPIANINSDGEFIDTIYSKFGTYKFMQTTNTYRNSTDVYLENGYDIHIIFDADNFLKTLSISGKGAERSNYLFEKSKIAEEFGASYKNIRLLNEKDFMKKLKSVKKSYDNLLLSYSNFPDDYKQLEKNDIYYNYLINLGSYVKNNKGETDENAKLGITKAYLKEMSTLRYDNENDFKYSDVYQNMVFGYYKRQSEKVAKEEDIPLHTAYYKALSTNSSEYIKNVLSFHYISNALKYEPELVNSDLKELCSGFIEISTNEEQKKQIEDKYNSLNRLTRGKPSPVFENYENYNGGKTSLVDFKGKYVFIDLWATWCSPCKREIPFLEEIEKIYHDKNIVFVSISLDKLTKRDAWRAMVKEKEMGGVQLLADNAMKSTFIKEYEVPFIPRFILIDPQGNIVDSSAPKPSDTEALTNLLNSLDI